VSSMLGSGGMTGRSATGSGGSGAVVSTPMPPVSSPEVGVEPSMASPHQGHSSSAASVAGNPPPQVGHS